MEAFSLLSAAPPPSGYLVSPYQLPHQAAAPPLAPSGYWVTGSHLTCPIWQVLLMDPPCLMGGPSSPLPHSQPFVIGPDEGADPVLQGMVVVLVGEGRMPPFPSPPRLPGSGQTSKHSELGWSNCRAQGQG